LAQGLCNMISAQRDTTQVPFNPMQHFQAMISNLQEVFVTGGFVIGGFDMLLEVAGEVKKI